MSTDTAEYCWIRLNITKDECILTDMIFLIYLPKPPDAKLHAWIPAHFLSKKHQLTRKFRKRRQTLLRWPRFFSGWQSLTSKRGNMVIPAFGGVYSINRWSFKGWMMNNDDMSKRYMLLSKKTTGDVKRTDKCRYGGCHSTNYPETTSPQLLVLGGKIKS